MKKGVKGCREKENLYDKVKQACRTVKQYSAVTARR